MSLTKLLTPLAGLGLVLLFAGCPPKGRPPALAGLPDPASRTVDLDRPSDRVPGLRAGHPGA